MHTDIFFARSESVETGTLIHDSDVAKPKAHPVADDLVRQLTFRGNRRQSEGWTPSSSGPRGRDILLAGSSDFAYFIDCTYDSVDSPFTSARPVPLSLNPSILSYPPFVKSVWTLAVPEAEREVDGSINLRHEGWMKESHFIGIARLIDVCSFD